jgi:VanZ family protein
MNRRVGLALGWAWVAAIVYLSLTPSPPKVDVEQSDKVGHLLAYGALAFWFCLLYRAPQARLFHMAGFVCMGIALEFAQGATGYRSFELADMAANTLGVAAGWLAARLAVKRILN